MDMHVSSDYNSYDTRMHLPSHCSLTVDNTVTTMHPNSIAVDSDQYLSTSYSDRYEYQNMNCKRDPAYQKQKRLLLLYHSAQCQSIYCTRTHCSKLKDLWVHMEQCKDDRCGVPHCLSSRCLLAHCRRCQNVNCLVCVPVRAQVNRTPLVQHNDNHQQTYSYSGRYSPPSVMAVEPCLSDEADDVSWK
jgi:TAZ zinc finger